MNDFIAELIKRPHPAIVHFPISLYPVSVLFLIGYNAQNNPALLMAAYGCFLIGSLFLVPVAITGFLDYVRLGVHSVKAHKLLQIHLLNGLAITIFGLIAGVYFWINSPITDTVLIPALTGSAVLLSMMVLAQGAIAALMIYQHKLGVDGETR
jgi:uncharacterized membrane protein